MRDSLRCIGIVFLFGSRLFAHEKHPTETKEHRDGYKQGVSEAEKELKEGHPTLYTGGLQMSLEQLDIQRVPGLRWEDDLKNRQ